MICCRSDFIISWLVAVILPISNCDKEGVIDKL